MNDRMFQIKEMIPKDVVTILDVGSGDGFFSKYFKTICLDLENADINQDLNKNQKIKFRSKSVDMVILSQILEHLGDCSEIVKESKRITKKYILVGLPNEITVDNRTRILIGKPGYEGYLPYWHKHFFTIKSAESFVRKMFGQYIKRSYIFGVRGGKFLPLFLRKWLAENFSSLMAKEVYYLIDVREL